MGKLYKIYKRNVYGVIGTLVFHILLFSLFLLADVNIKGETTEEEILIEFPDILPEPEEEEIAEQQESEPATNEASSPQNQIQSHRSTIASNRLAKNEEFFDDDYMNEVEAAKQLVSDVNNQLSKEAVSLDDIKMPVQTTEGRDPETIENVVYTGESNIVYYLENRYHVSLPIPVYLAQSGGVVIVDISVSRDGRVIYAEPRKSSSVRDNQIYLYAKVAASRTIFNKSDDAPEPQKGTIQYTFVAQ